MKKRRRKKRLIKKEHKKPKLKGKNINFNINIFLSHWIWTTLGSTFFLSIILFSILFILENKNYIEINQVWIILISLIPFILFFLYWSTISITFRLIFKKISKDIEKNSVFPLPSSALIKEEEISIKKYISKGNISKIKQYKVITTKMLFYMIILLFLFILFNFIFVGLTQLKVIEVSTEWLYLFGLLSNIVSLVLSAVFGFIVSNAINAPENYEKKYHAIKTKLYNFKVFLNINDLKKINYQQLKYRNINFLPLYFYQSLLIPDIKHQQYWEELDNWKYYLNLSPYLNQFSWLLFFHYVVNKKDQTKVIKKTKYINKLAFQVKKVHKILFYTQNDYLYFNKDYDRKLLEQEYNKLLTLLNHYKKRFSLKLIIASLQKNGLKITQEINQKKDENIIDERDFNINLYQLNYLEYLFSIVFLNSKNSKNKEYFK